MLKMSPRELAIAGVLILVLALFAVVADAKAATKQGTKAQICEVFGSRCAAALRVASCETGGTFYPRSVGSAGERGVFQIHPIHFGWLDENRLWSPAYNARIAYWLSRGRNELEPLVMSAMTCAICGRKLEAPLTTHYVQVTGWERPGRGLNNRSGSSLVLRERTDKLAHSKCIASELAGIAVGQQQLIGEER